EDVGAAADIRRLGPGGLLHQSGDQPVGEGGGVVASDDLRVVTGVEATHRGVRLRHGAQLRVVGVQGELSPEQQHEWVADQRFDEVQHRAETAVDVGVVDVIDVQTQRLTLAVSGPDLVGQVSDDQQDAPDAQLVARQLELAGEQRLATHFEQYLGRLPV